jgi:enoyl-CoA hydratase/carnithine racemase
MTLPMDIRPASTEARIGFVFSRRGLIPEAASSWFLPRVVGISRALEWVETGRIFDAEEALSGGLVRSLHDPASLLDTARQLALEIAANTALVAVALSHRLLWTMLTEPHPIAAHRTDSRGLHERGRSAHAREGIGPSSPSGRLNFPTASATAFPT